MSSRIASTPFSLRHFSIPRIIAAAFGTSCRWPLCVKGASTANKKSSARTEHQLGDRSSDQRNDRRKDRRNDRPTDRPTDRPAARSMGNKKTGMLVSLSYPYTGYQRAPSLCALFTFHPLWNICTMSERQFLIFTTPKIVDAFRAG